MMARSFSGVKIMSGLVSDGIFNALIRREYRAGVLLSQTVASSSGIMKKEEEEKKSIEKAAWVPDPITGYYRPENYVDQIDAVDLRAKLLKPRRNIINSTKF